MDTTSIVALVGVVFGVIFGILGLLDTFEPRDKRKDLADD